MDRMIPLGIPIAMLQLPAVIRPVARFKLAAVKEEFVQMMLMQFCMERKYPTPVVTPQV
jgi:hypothetical protein